MIRAIERRPIHYRDFYGCTAVIKTRADGSASLTVRIPSGKLVEKSIHKNINAAYQAMRRLSEYWERRS